MIKWLVYLCNDNPENLIPEYDSINFEEKNSKITKENI